MSQESEALYKSIIDELVANALTRFGTATKDEGLTAEEALSEVLRDCMQAYQTALQVNGYNAVLLEIFRMLGQNVRDAIKGQKNPAELKIMPLHNTVSAALGIASVLNTLRDDDRFGLILPGDYDQQLEVLKKTRDFCESSHEEIRAFAYSQKGRK